MMSQSFWLFWPSHFLYLWVMHCCHKIMDPPPQGVTLLIDNKFNLVQIRRKQIWNFKGMMTNKGGENFLWLKCIRVMILHSSHVLVLVLHWFTFQTQIYHSHLTYTSILLMIAHQFPVSFKAIFTHSVWLINFFPYFLHMQKYCDPKKWLSLCTVTTKSRQ